MTDISAIEILSRFFGSYKAEWLQESLFDLYTEPSYFPELTTARPCVLVGGRGTGKTTVLKSLSYEGQAEIIRKRCSPEGLPKLSTELAGMKYFGFYYRVSTPRVTAFSGGGLSSSEWQRLFNHYINITFALKTFRFLAWHKEHAGTNISFTNHEYNLICQSLSLDSCNNIQLIESTLEMALLRIEAYINNIGLEPRPRLSAPTALEQLFDLLTQKPAFSGRTFFLIIDEYENFQDEQQQVINTLIKHTSTAFTFKIGVRYLGWRVKHTLNETEFLISPSDYVSINISSQLSEADFRIFAEKVCNARLRAIYYELHGTTQDNTIIPTVRDLFPSLGTQEEAVLLGVEGHAADLRREISNTKDRNLQKVMEGTSDLDLFVLWLLTQNENDDFREAAKQYAANPDPWLARFSEYRYAALFNIRQKKAGIRKYYAGWAVYTKLCAGNIRYLLELVERALISHLRDLNDFEQPVSFKHQTEAAQFVGQKNLEELSGLSIFGAKLTKLVLALGRIFQVLAQDSAGHAHEVNQFRISPEHSQTYSSSQDWLLKSETAASKILRASVMHLALIQFPGNKPKGEGDLRDSTYQLHPIFAPYFVFSYRKRRNLMLGEDEILGLIEKPKETITQVISDQNRHEVPEVPNQLQLFEGFWE